MKRMEPLTVLDASLGLVIDSSPFFKDGEVVGLCIASDIGPQLKIIQ
jgi:hypothetical protein